jgi:glucose-1-phosphate thymidylyltransferase
MKAMTTLGLCKIPEPERFGIVRLEENRVIKIAEKPEIPFSPLASASTYLIEPDVLDFIERIRPSKRGEYDMADVFSLLIEENELVIGYELDKWIDLGRAWDYLDANMYFLKKMSKEIHDSVKLGNNTYIQNSFIDKD